MALVCWKHSEWRVSASGLSHLNSLQSIMTLTFGQYLTGTVRLTGSWVIQMFTDPNTRNKMFDQVINVWLTVEVLTPNISAKTLSLRPTATRKQNIKKLINDELHVTLNAWFKNLCLYSGNSHSLRFGPEDNFRCSGLNGMPENKNMFFKENLGKYLKSSSHTHHLSNRTREMVRLDTISLSFFIFSKASSTAPN